MVIEPFMHFKDFITRQRIAIIISGLLISSVAIYGALESQYQHIWGAVCVDVAVSAMTVVFTALVIDYLGIREEHERTKGVAGLAEDELASTCFRAEWAMARLFGMEPRQVGRGHIGTREEARIYIDEIRSEVSDYLESHSMSSPGTPLNPTMLFKYIERLEVSRTELEQTLMLYEYAMVYSLRERVLALRNELQVADNILGLIDLNSKLNEANMSLIRVVSESVHAAIKGVLEHNSRTRSGTTLKAKDNQMA